MTDDLIRSRSRYMESCADTLLRRVIATGSVPPETVARTLAVTGRTLTSYLLVPGRIPVEQQLRLASFVIKNVPDLARLGYRLRAEAAAAISARSSAADAHAEPRSTTP